jgi:beta-glucanase (GH16 family)
MAKGRSEMRNRAQVAFVVLAVATLGFTGVAAGQTLVWSDEFDGPFVDRTYWTYGVGGHGFGNGELQYHTARPENARIENGNLIIEARRENYNGKQFTSARLKTHGRLAFKYGTLEARIKLPDVDNGVWPAFWLLGDNIGQFDWPACGELDIMEVGQRSGYLAGVVNRRVLSAAHWDYQGNYASYGDFIDWPVDLYNDYHIYKVEWTPTLIKTYLDGVNIWTIDISDPAANSLEEFHEPMFIITNVSVGGWNFVEITDPALITAPFPGRMYVDYIRLYDHGDTELYLAEDTAETGGFGVYTETTPVNNSVTYDADASLYLWNNLTPTPTDAYEGDEAWGMTAAAGNWFGMGVFSHVNRNMQHYSDGHLHFHMKTSSPAAFKIGAVSAAAGESWVSFATGEEKYGLVRDGSWHEVVIPLNSFLNVDFHTITQLFMIAGDPPAAPFEFAIDNVYWSPSVPRPTPENGSFGIFTEDPAHKTAGEFALGVDGELYIWENTLQPGPEDPYEGDTSLSLQSTPGFGWFGAAFTPTIKHNLTGFRYAQSRLHLALKTSSLTTFQLGMRSGNVDDIGQKWIKFEAGNDPYGFVRDGQWHVIEIPMSDIADAVDLSQVSLIFELLGTDGPISGIEIDDVCLLGGGPALADGIPGDLDEDGDIDAVDAVLLLGCVSGPGNTFAPGGCAAGEFTRGDLDADGDLDLADCAEFMTLFAQ